MKTYIKTFLAAAALVGAVAGPAFSTVVIDNSSRALIIGNYQSTTTIPLNSSGVFNAFVETPYPTSISSGNTRTVRAEQNTTINTSSIFGSGAAIVGFSFEGPTNTSAYSSFSVIFTLDKAYDFILTGNLQKNIDGGYGQAYFRLDPESGTQIYYYNTDIVDQKIFNHSGTLNAGTYYIGVGALVDKGSEGAGTWYGGTSSFDFDLDLTEVTGGTGTNPVPEPSTMLLLGGGLAGLAFWRRKRT